MALSHLQVGGNDVECTTLFRRDNDAAGRNERGFSADSQLSGRAFRAVEYQLLREGDVDADSPTC